MRAVDVMSRPVVTVRADDLVEQATAVLTSHRIGAAPVLDPTGDLVGMVSEGDLLAARAGRVAVVADVMSTNVVALPPDADLAEVVQALLHNHVRSVPVVSDVGELVGIVSRRDVLSTVVRSDDVVQMDVQHRLDEYAGDERRWTVGLREGVVTIAGPFADEAEAEVVRVLARTVTGVSTVEISSRVLSP